MTGRAVVFDVGGVLERVGAPDFLARYRGCLPAPEFAAVLERVDPDGLIAVGGMTEPRFLARYAELLALDDGQRERFRGELWDWYCGELDEELVAFVRELRPRYRIGILSNSADGARREETRRYGLPSLADVLVYSHEIGVAKPDPAAYLITCDRLGVAPAGVVFVDDEPECVAGAEAVGMRGVLHRDTQCTIERVRACLNE